MRSRPKTSKAPWKRRDLSQGRVDDSGNYTPEYLEWVSDRQVCEGLVQVASANLNKDLRLIFGGASDGITGAKTDGESVFIPIDHPNRRIATKHELAHIYFDSDLVLRATFVELLIDEFDLQLPPSTRAKLVHNICLLINIFDDVRVNALWGDLFPGDGVKMRQWYFEVIGPESKKKALKDFRCLNDVEHDIRPPIPYCVLIALGQEAFSSRWGDLEDEVKAIVARCSTGITFEAMLGISRDFLNQVIERMDPRDLGDDSAGGIISENSGVNVPVLGKEAKKGQVPKAKHILQTSTADLLEVSEGQIEQKLEALRDTIGEGTEPKDAANYVVDYIRETNLKPKSLTHEERGYADELRGLFRLARERYRRKRSLSGGRLVVEELIQAELNDLPLECYEIDARSPGLYGTFLIDLSGSMKSVFDSVDTAYRMLAHALGPDPVNAFGFNQRSADRVNIYRYDEGISGLLTRHNHVYGMTPLGDAIRYVRNNLPHRRGSHLFVISDGLPRQRSKTGYIREAFLVNQAEEEVQALRDRGVQVWCVNIGYGQGPAELNKIFGYGRWTHVETQDVARGVTAFVRDTFLMGLK